MNKINMSIVLVAVLAMTHAGMSLPHLAGRGFGRALEALSGGKRRERGRRMSGGKPCKKQKPKAPNDGRWHMKFHRGRSRR